MSDVLNIPGQIPAKINDLFATNITDFSVNGQRVSNVYTGFGGNFGKSFGIAQYSFDFSMPPRTDKGGWQFSPAQLTKDFVFSFFIGAQEYRLTGCSVDDVQLQAAMSAGSTKSSFKCKATRCVPDLVAA